MAGLGPATHVLGGAAPHRVEVTGTDPRNKSGEVTTWEGEDAGLEDVGPRDKPGDDGHACSVLPLKTLAPEASHDLQLYTNDLVWEY
ncbi:hypothetical protein [Microvirga zambiensis]|uniref:hypothetical protein n=1 Tax=Microvirga zambiensis TaxID=1402137 RepID=UPI00191FE231|nr:hypothetical protein [Microvirga zambiensis]